ncbi:flagellar hook protein [Campylobacter lanienae]|uniref:flagellin N-terminal helical domain-containing protein n=1 Tax=Campylobacter lanienae TaxID=75658 RepID=UPI000BB4060B|nr:flagellar hook protein [Campylobacter lanienae]
MRITNQLMNFNNIYNYQKNSTSLYQSQQAFSSGLKIQHSYEGSAIYVDAARLEYEGNLLKQVETTTLKATEFSKNSDQALNDFVSKLTEFKTKLIQAANDIHDATSRNAIANDLEGIKQNLIDIANTTINGQYLFSGTALDTMPIDTLGNYHGNGETISAVIGTSQTAKYNIDGESLFLGSDNDYNKIITTNVNLINYYNRLENPDDPVKYVELTDDLRDLIGENYRSEEFNKANPPKTDDFSIDKLADQNTTFFLQGRKPDGTTFATKITMTPDSSIQSLLDNIGYALGNDRDDKNKVVEVTMNNSGQIEIKDIRNGNQMTELHLFGLTPQQSTEKYNVGGFEINIDPATSANYKVTTSTDANGKVTIAAASINNNNTYYITTDAQGQLTVATNNGATAVIQNLGNPPFAVDLNDLGNNGIDATDFTAFDPNDADQVRNMSSTNVRDKDGSWVSVSDLSDLATIEENVKNGKVYLTEFIKSSFNDILGVKNDATDYNKLQFEKNDNILTGSVSQVVKGTNEFATDATKIKDVAGAGLQDNEDSNITMQIKSKNGKYYQVKIDFSDPLSASDPKATQLTITETNADGTPIIPQGGATPVPVYQGNIMLGKYNEMTKATDGVVTQADDISYKQLNDIVAMVAAGNLPDDRVGNQVAKNLSDQNLFPGVQINDANALKTALKTNVNDPATEAIIDQAVDAAGLTFPVTNKQEALGKVKDNIINNTDYATARFEAYNKAVDAANASVNVELNYRGQMQITDKSATVSNIEISIFETFSANKPEFGKEANSTVAGSLFNFNANNMISIDEPSVDIFKDLDDMIQAVRDGSYRGNPDGNNARTTGIQGALKRIDHIQDHVNKLHTQIGSYTNVLESSGTRASMLYVNIESVKTDIVGADLGESMLIYKQYLLQFEAMLQTSAMIGKISLLNYM